MPGPLGLLGGTQRKVQFVQEPTGTVISIDCTVSENHQKESPPTEFPLETGESISDHIILKPFGLEIQGIISDSPIKPLNALLSTVAGAVLPPTGIVAAGVAMSLFSALAGSKSPSVVAYAQLLQLQASRKPFDVITTLRRYDTMWIKSLTVPRDASTGQVLVFNVSLVQLLLVSPQSVNIQKFSNGALAANQASLGKKQTEVNAFQVGDNDFAQSKGLGANLGTVLQ